MADSKHPLARSFQYPGARSHLIQIRSVQIRSVQIRSPGRLGSGRSRNQERDLKALAGGGGHENAGSEASFDRRGEDDAQDSTRRRNGVQVDAESTAGTRELEAAQGAGPLGLQDDLAGWRL